MSHKKAHKAQKLVLRFSVFFVLFCGGTLQGQQASRVYLKFDTPDFKLWLMRDSQTVAALMPKGAGGFDFTPGDRLKHHLGDLTLRIRTGTSGPWKQYDTSDSRKPVESLMASGTTTQDAGYLQVTRLSGRGPALVVVPDGQTPFEAYQPLNEPMRRSQTFEGAFAWMVHTQALAEDEWYNVEPWNPPTMATIAPGAGKTYGVKFLLADEIRKIEATLARYQRPVAIGIPGYVLPMDIDGRLFIKHNRKVTRFTVHPAGALELKEDKPTQNWAAYSVRGKTWGRARLTLTYDDNSTQSISYYVIKPSAQVVADLGHFLFTRQWFDDPDSPFNRSPSIMSYDREKDQIVTQDSRVWIAWCKYFGYDDKALVSLNSILGYMPALPHWGYNGNARRYWDFLYGGKLRRIERQLHHYGSGLNAIPVLSHYREHPDDEYLLRVGYGGMMGALSNIDQEGFASVAFHSFPSTLKWDPYTGDYGPNFFGHAFNVATYVINHPELGWQTFGGNVSVKDDWVNVQPLDSFRRRVYIAPLGLWLTLDAGPFERVSINTQSNVVRVTLSPADKFTPDARLRVQQPAKLPEVGAYAPRQKFVNERDAFTIPLKGSPITIELSHKKAQKAQ